MQVTDLSQTTRTSELHTVCW